MSLNPQTIKLPAVRLKQLSAIAAARKLPSMSAAITYLIRKEIEAGTIHHDLPGIAVTRHGEEIGISFGDEIPARLPTASAIALANSLEEVVAGGSSVINMTPPTSFSVIRRGSAGINIRIPFGQGDGHTMAADIAVDLAGIIRKVAA